MAGSLGADCSIVTAAAAIAALLLIDSVLGLSGD